MTAEVAVLNKSAVALAADSAVTISVGDEEKKTYDTADKLFELCHFNPIGVMVYNGLSFAEIPLQTIIKQFRSEGREFNYVNDAAEALLECLNTIGKRSPQRVKDDSVKQIFSPVLDAIRTRYFRRAQKLIFSSTEAPADFREQMVAFINEAVTYYEGIYREQKNARFVGTKEIPVVPDHVISIIRESVAGMFEGPVIDDEIRARIVEIAKLSLTAEVLSDNSTGIVIAGFGTKELFPTLVSFELDGMVGDHLKYVRTNFVDIDRSGARARVLPFAQKEMMDRFMYGMDDGIERSITNFCAETIPTIRKAVMDRVTFDGDDDKAKFESDLSGAEKSFVEGLGTTAFAEIRKASEVALEGMVEFMPKPELAKMAEALVNLTSIKRRVSQGMETVGGPIDVAVISQAEGFVWVKRKHYFPAELNPRYFERVRDQARLHREKDHAQAAKPRSPRKTRGRTATPIILEGPPIEGPPAGREGDAGGDKAVPQTG